MRKTVEEGAMEVMGRGEHLQHQHQQHLRHLPKEVLRLSDGGDLEDRRKKRTPMEDTFSPHPLSSSGGSSGPDDDPQFEWGEGRARGSNRSGLQVVAAAAEAAMTSLSGRKRKFEDEKGCCREGDGHTRRRSTGRGEKMCPRSADEEHAQGGAISGAVTCGGGTLGGAAAPPPPAQAGNHNGWHVDDIDDNLAADLDGSLSGLEVDLTSSSSSYHMSESLLSLPALTVFKQEVLSPTSQNEPGCRNRPPPVNVGNGNKEDHEQDETPRKEQPNSPASGLQIATEQQNNLHMLQYDLCNEKTNGNHMEQMSATMEGNGGKRRREEGAAGGGGGGGLPFGGIGLGNRTGGLGGNDTMNFHQRFEKSSNADVNEPAEDSRFQYVLAAATSIATKVNEETLTYLNQGQSYEIKLKKLGDLLAYRGKIFKSVIRICFHERRLQYAEREQLAAWQQSRPGDRVLEVDVPLSYGACEIVQDPSALNAVEFLWDPTKEVGVYIKVNCISTEFTPKKHGGEKGVPFRIQVETYSQSSNITESQRKSSQFVMGKRLHAAACQIKVFKLKGADRKHKQDREKILKRPPSEQEKYQPSYDCTVLNDIHPDSVYLGPLTVGLSSCATNGASFSPTDNSQALVPSQGLVKEEGSGSPGRRCIPLPQAPAIVPAISSSTPLQNIPEYFGPSHHQSGFNVSASALTAPQSGGAAVNQDATTDAGIEDFSANIHEMINSDATTVEMAQWLRTHRFSSYLHTFASFSGADLLRLSRDDLIQICGLADGIRLYNALHMKCIAPRLTLYICLGHGIDSVSHGMKEGTSGDCPVYHALYLSSASSGELSAKLARIAGVSAVQLHDVFVQGPSGVHVLLTDDVVQNLPDESLFSIDILTDSSGERYRILLKAASC